MLCYQCENIKKCTMFNALYCKSKDFVINDCKDYDEGSKYKYKLIAQNDNLMKLIYDYFTGNVKEPDVTDEEVVDAIRTALLVM